MNSDTRGEVVDEASKWLVGGGILALALAPLALPAIVLLLVAALPLVALGLVVGLLAAAVIGPVVLARRLLRRMRGWKRREGVRSETLNVKPAAAGPSA